MDGKIEYLKLPIIVDIGSGEVKAGFSGEEKPKTIFKNYFGEPKYKKVLRTFNKDNQELNEQYIGDDCEKYLGLIKLRFPVKHGVFEKEQDILSVFNYLYSKLGINSQEIKEHPVLITEPLLNPNVNREKISYSLFDNLGVPALFFASQPILSLFSTSKTSGTILESGEGVTQSCVVYEGYSIPCTYERYNYGGGDVTEYLKNLLKKRGYHFYNSTEFRLVNDIKENSCFCYGNNIKNEIIDAKKSANKNLINYYLPDGSSISIGDDCDKYLGLTKLRHPVNHGVFENEQDILTIFNHIFTKLGITSQEKKEHPILIAEPILNLLNILRHLFHHNYIFHMMKVYYNLHIQHSFVLHLLHFLILFRKLMMLKIMIIKVEKQKK